MILLQSFIIYLGLLYLMYLFGKIYYKSNNLLYFLIPILLFTLVFGLRYGVGIDYLGYLQLFNLLGSHNEAYLYLRYEPAFIFIIEGLYKLKLSYVYLFIIFAFIQIFVLYLSFIDKRYILPYLPIVLILSGAAIMTFMNGMRQVVSFCLFLYSIRYIEKQKILHYSICIFIGFLFHQSALLLLPIYFIFKNRRGYFNDAKLQLILLAVSYIVAPFIDIKLILSPFLSIIDALGYTQYLENRADEFFNSERNFGLGYIIIILQYVILIINSNKVKAYFHDHTYSIMYDLFFIGIILEGLFISIPQIMRIVLYFTLFKIVILSYTLCYFSKKVIKSASISIQYILIIMILVYFFMRMLLYPESNMSDYVFFFQEEYHQYKHIQYNQI